MLPKPGRIPIEEIDNPDIKNAFAPIWPETADTTRKTITRLRIVLRNAAAVGRDVGIQASDKAKALLGKSRHTPKHVPSLIWRDVPEVYARLDAGAIPTWPCAADPHRHALKRDPFHQRLQDRGGNVGDPG